MVIVAIFSNDGVIKFTGIFLLHFVGLYRLLLPSDIVPKVGTFYWSMSDILLPLFLLDCLFERRTCRLTPYVLAQAISHIEVLMLS